MDAGRIGARRVGVRLPGVRLVGAGRCILAALILAGGLPASALASDEAQPASSAWGFLQSKYYGDRVMGLVDENFMSLQAPQTTPDPASTPLTLRFTHDPRRPIKRIRVFVDNNPSPLVATLDFPDTTALTQIDMRVRVDRFTSVRAVAETARGELEMRSTWVKASGGCSAPPGPAAGGTLGEIRVRPSADARAVQISIRHPNNSGFQIDPRSGEPIPAHYISELHLRAGGKALLDAEMGISISENPTLRIASDAPLPAPLSIDAVDSETHAHFRAIWAGGSSAQHAQRASGTIQTVGW
ncbi:MAG TPA: quinoprotein dehydrogenase-associated SoxYZ-like carrier [Steroidobacteraceae bacterium]